MRAEKLEFFQQTVPDLHWTGTEFAGTCLSCAQPALSLKVYGPDEFEPTCPHCTEAQILDAIRVKLGRAAEGKPAPEKPAKPATAFAPRAPARVQPAPNGSLKPQVARLPAAASLPTVAVTLDEVIAIFRRWLHLPDDWHIKVILGAYAANLLPGDPVWLMVISAPGSGKTEVIQSLAGLPHVKVNSSLSGEGSLLSATPKRERGQGASGGLLREIGEFGVLVLKDFTSLLQMHQDSQAPLLAALREVYDGSWTRRVGVDGGRVIHWEGKLGVIAACTPAIDLHHAVMGAMGERFLFYRFPVGDASGQAGRALRHVGQEGERREQLTAAVSGLIAGLSDPVRHAVLADADRERLVDLACLAVRCRSAVQRDRRTREIEFIPDPEAPGRLVGGLARLLAGLEAVGVARAEAWQIIAKVSVDSMPALRWAVFQEAAARADGDGLYTSEAALATRHPTITARRALEDLHAHDLLTRAKGGERNADTWELTPWARQTYDRLRGLFVPVTVGQQAEGQFLRNPAPLST